MFIKLFDYLLQGNFGGSKIKPIFKTEYKNQLVLLNNLLKQNKIARGLIKIKLGDHSKLRQPPKKCLWLGSKVTTGPLTWTHFGYLATGQHYGFLQPRTSHMMAIYKVFAKNWCLLLVFGKNAPQQTMDLLNNHGIHLMTTTKKVVKPSLFTWVPWSMTVMTYAGNFRLHYGDKWGLHVYQNTYLRWILLMYIDW